MPDIDVTGLTAESTVDGESVELPDGTPGLAAPATPGPKPFWTVDRVKPALVKASGIIADAAKILSDAHNRPCSRRTISELVNSNSELRVVRDEAMAVLFDGCFAACVARAEAGDERAQEFLLTHLGPPFRNKQEVSGPDGGPIQVTQETELPSRVGNVVFKDVDDALLTRDECIELAGIAEHVDMLGGLQDLPLAEFARMNELRAKAKRQKVEAKQ
jgi:hypothetical protein